MYYEVHGEDGSPVVVIHGFQGDHLLMGGFVRMLQARNRVLLFDQRGTGQSDKPDEPYTVELIADETAELMKHAGFSPAHVVGCSMGGVIAQEEVVLRHPDQVLSLVLGCTTSDVRRLSERDASASADMTSATASTATDRQYTASERATAVASVLFACGFIESHPEVVLELVRQREALPLNQVGVKRRGESLVSWGGTTDRLSAVHCPTLVITGAEDRMVPPHLSSDLADAIPGAKLVVVPDAGHGFWIERPMETETALTTFLDGVGTKK
jgi:pimeloyl-ACP methyl ester carboxylesterase